MQGSLVWPMAPVEPEGSHKNPLVQSSPYTAPILHSAPHCPHPPHTHALPPHHSPLLHTLSVGNKQACWKRQEAASAQTSLFSTSEVMPSWNWGDLCQCGCGAAYKNTLQMSAASKARKPAWHLSRSHRGFFLLSFSKKNKTKKNEKEKKTQWSGSGAEMDLG